MAASNENARAGSGEATPFLNLGGKAANEKSAAPSGVGTLLCATRMRMGKDLQRIAEVLHIRYNYLVAIEDGRYEDLPGQAYAIGFVRAYADHLELDGDEIVRRYKEDSSGVKSRAVFEFPLPSADAGIPSGALILIAILLGIVVYGVWYSIAGTDRDAVQVIQEVPDRLTALLKPEETAPPPAEVQAEQTVDPNAPEQADTTATVDFASAPAEATAAPADAAIASAITASPVDVVELRAKSDLWVTLRAAEKADRTQFLRKGETFRVPEAGMTLVTGTPSDLEILVNGQVMPPLDAGVFARGVALDPQRLKPGAVSQ